MITIEKPGKTRLSWARCAAFFVGQLVAGACASSAAAYTESTLRSFAGGTGDGATPYAGLYLDPTSGNLYGTTYLGGTSNQGVVFEISTSGSGYQVLYNFSGSTCGAGPMSAPILSTGNLYGTTVYSSIYSGVGSGPGVVYALLNGSGPIAAQFCTPSQEVAATALIPMPA